MTTQIVTIERDAPVVTIEGGEADTSVISVDTGFGDQVISLEQAPQGIIVSEPVVPDVVTVETGPVGERGPAGERGPPGDAGDDVPDLTLIFDNQLV